MSDRVAEYQLERYFKAVDRYFKDKTDANSEAIAKAMLDVKTHVICTKGTCGCLLKHESRHGKRTSTTHLRRRECHRV